MSEIRKIWGNEIATFPFADQFQFVLYSDHERVARRVEELGQAVGLLTTLHPTMVMDADHPLDMAQKIAAHVALRVETLEKVRGAAVVYRRIENGLYESTKTCREAASELDAALAALDAQRGGDEVRTYFKETPEGLVLEPIRSSMSAEEKLTARIALLEAAVKAADRMRDNYLRDWRETEIDPCPPSVDAYDIAAKAARGGT